MNNTTVACPITDAHAILERVLGAAASLRSPEQIRAHLLADDPAEYPVFATWYPPGHVTIRAYGVQTRTVFPTKNPNDYPRAVARAVLAALLDLSLVRGQ